MLDRILDSKRNRAILFIAVAVPFLLYKFGAFDRLFAPAPVISPPPQVLNDGSVRYTMKVKASRKRPPGLNYGYDKGTDTWVVRLKDVAACETPGDDDICRKWSFTVKEPHFKPWDNGGGVHFWFWLKWPGLTPGPSATEIQRSNPDYIDVSTTGPIRDNPPRHDPVTNKYTGLGSGSAEEVNSICRMDVEVSPGLMRLREATQAERDSVVIPDYLKERPCLNQNYRLYGDGKGTAIVGRGGTTVMRISPGSLPAEQRYIYYDRDGAWRTAGYCALDDETKEQTYCKFQLYLTPRRNIEITFNARHLGDFRAIHDGVLDFMKNTTEAFDWEPEKK